jgi:hypothetical protein
MQSRENKKHTELWHNRSTIIIKDGRVLKKKKRVDNIVVFFLLRKGGWLVEYQK